jgi:uroporphyrinogen decarboxylase
MNSKERIITSLAHKQTDRVPLDLGGVVSGIHIQAYKRLLSYLHITDNNIHFYDFNQQIVVPCEAVLERLHIDTRYLHLPSSLLPESYIPNQEGPWAGNYDQFGVFWGNKADLPLEKRLYYSPVIHPLADMETPQQIHAFNWPDGKDLSIMNGLKEYHQNLRQLGSYAIVSRVLACIYEYTTFMFGLKTAMKHIRRNPALIQAAMEELLQYWTDFATTYLNQIGADVDVIAINGDLAEQSGPLMNPKVYETLIKPIEGEFVNRIRKISKAPINYHSCGSVVSFLPHFADIGYNAANPVQVSATDMEPCSLKQRFGDRIGFWGGLCDSQKTLPFGTPDDVRAEVKRNLTCFAPNGGYVGSNIHNITAEVPAENIVAMFDTAFEFRL